jgi:hypothetical protein
MATAEETAVWARFHFRFGWWTLLVFACLGLGLEAFHGFKVAWYLDVANETRRLAFRLAHAHGVLISLLHVAYGATLHALGPTGRGVLVASRAFVAASALLPVGFLLAGFGVDGGDPGPAIALVPVGALCLLTGLACAAWSLRGARAR